MKIYKIKKLIDGWRVDLKFKGLLLVAVPDHFRGVPFKVVYKNEEMVINDWGTELVHSLGGFRDKYGRGKEYVLGYFIWKPDRSQQSLFPLHEKDYLFA